MAAQIGSNSYVSPDFELAEDVAIGRNACLDGSGKIGRGAVIGHGVVIDGAVRIGAGSRVGHHSVLSGEVEIGRDNTIHAFCSIGDSPDHPDMRMASGGIRIGDGNVVREYTSIHAPTVNAATIIGSRCYVMAYCHIAHDCVLGDDVKMAHHATLAGHVTVGEFAYLALHSMVHQRLRIGAHCMIGMNAVITKHAPPCSVVFRNRFSKINRRGLEGRGISAAEIDRIEDWYRGIPGNGDANFALIGLIERFIADCGATPVYLLAEA